MIWKNLWQTAAAIAFLLLAWGVAYLVAGNELLVPKGSAVLKELNALLSSGRFWRGFGYTLLRAAAAFGFSLAIALAFAVLAYTFPAVEGLLAPILAVFRSLPVLAVLLILLSFFSASAAPVAVAFLSLFPMLYTGILAAISGVDKELIQTAYSYGASPWKRATKVYLPLAAPAILRECGGALSFSVKLVVSAEVLVNTAKSLGGMMQEARVYGEIAALFALVTLTFLAGLIIELSFSALTHAVEKRIK